MIMASPSSKSHEQVVRHASPHPTVQAVAVVAPMVVPVITLAKTKTASHATHHFQLRAGITVMSRIVSASSGKID